MRDMSVTCEVSRTEISSLVRLPHLLNIQLMSVTREVSRLERSRSSRHSQSENIPCMLVTCELSKPDKSRWCTRNLPLGPYAIAS